MEAPALKPSPSPIKKIERTHLMKNEHYNQALQKEQDMKQLNDYNSNLQIQLNIQYLQCDDYDSLSPWVKPGFNS